MGLIQWSNLFKQGAKCKDLRKLTTNFQTFVLILEDKKLI